MIPEKAQQKVNEAVVIAVGPGAKNKVYGILCISKDGCLFANIFAKVPLFCEGCQIANRIC